jgi:hypothetical protein
MLIRKHSQHFVQWHFDRLNHDWLIQRIGDRFLSILIDVDPARRVDAASHLCQQVSGDHQSFILYNRFKAQRLQRLVQDDTQWQLHKLSIVAFA